MNSTIKNDILTSYRLGTTDFEVLAKYFGCSASQVEKVVFPNGRFKKVLPLTVPKISKVLTTGTFNGEEIRITEVHLLKPKQENHAVTKTPARIEVQLPATTTKSTAKSPTARLGALKAWETMREERAAKEGKIYIRKTDEELRVLAGFTDEKIKEPTDPIVKVKPEALERRREQIEKRKAEQEGPIFLDPRIKSRLSRHKDEELYVDSARIVEAGRAITAYCDHKNITPEQLIEAYEQLVAINKLLGKS